MVLSKTNCCSKRSIQKYALNGHSHVQIIHWVVMFSSVDPSDDQEDCFRMMNCGWRHLQVVWPFYSFSFRTSLAAWFTGCIGFPRNCLISNGSLRHCLFLITPRFQTRKGPHPLTPLLLRQVSRLLCPMCILQLRLRTRRCVGFWISSHPAFWFHRCCEYSPDFWIAIGLIANEELVRNMWRQVHRCRFRILPHFFLLPFCSCIPFAIVSGQLVKLEFLAQQVATFLLSS